MSRMPQERKKDKEKQKKGNEIADDTSSSAPMHKHLGYVRI
jgi:hypothetical protein